MVISFYYHWYFNELITTSFCTCHDSTAVVACAKNCSDNITMKGIYSEKKFVSNLNFGVKSVSVMDPMVVKEYWRGIRLTLWLFIICLINWVLDGACYCNSIVILQPIGAQGYCCYLHLSICDCLELMFGVLAWNLYRFKSYRLISVKCIGSNQ